MVKRADKAVRAPIDQIHNPSRNQCPFHFILSLSPSRGPTNTTASTSSNWTIRILTNWRDQDKMYNGITASLNSKLVSQWMYDKSS